MKSLDIKIVRDLNTGKVNFKTKKEITLLAKDLYKAVTKKDVMLDYQTSVKLLNKFNIKVH
ncbi:hypothetical protein [Tetragenococcus phage phiWJ7]|nr:hypothetical protein [Tetragenococcus phage phiWJ7]